MEVRNFCFMKVSRVSQEGLRDVSGMCQGCSVFDCLFQRCFREIFRMFQKCFKVDSRMFPRIFNQVSREFQKGVKDLLTCF